jgi:hypothetical protein
MPPDPATGREYGPYFFTEDEWQFQATQPIPLSIDMLYVLREYQRQVDEHFRTLVDERLFGKESP